MAENTATPIPRQVAESQNRPAVVEDQKEEMEQKIKKPRKRKPAQTPGQPADKALEKMAESEPNQPNTPDHQITQQQLDEQLLKLSPEQLETQIANGTDEEKAALRERYEQLKLKQKTVTSEQVVTESLTGDEDLSESEKLLLALGKDNKAQAIGSIALSWFPPARIAYEALTSGYVNYRQAAKDGPSRFQLAKMAAGYGTRIGAAVMTGGLSEAALYGTKALISFSKGDINVKNALFGAGSLAIGLTTGNIVAGNIANESVRTMATAATRFATTEALFQGAQLVVENPKEREKLRKGAAFASGIVAGVSVAQGADYLIPGDSPVEDVLQTDIGELTGDAADGLLDNFRGFFSFLNTNESNEMNDNQANTRNIKELPDLTVREEIVQGANETAENLLNRLTGKSEEDILREKIEERVGGLTGETNQTDDPIGLIQRLFGIEPPAPDGKTEDNTETIRGIFETDDSKPIIKPETSASEESFFEKFGWRPSEQEIGEIENERPELNRTPEPKESQNNKINPDIIASNAEAQPVVPPAPIPEMDPYEISRLEEVFRIPERSDSLIPNPDIPNGFNINFDGIADQDVIRMIHYDVTNLLNTQIGEQFANSYDPANPDSVQTREFTFNAHLLNGDEVSVPISISNEEFNAYRAADPVNPLSFSDYVLGKTNLALTSQGILRDQSGIPITTGMQAFYDAWDYSEPERDLLRMNIMNQAANETGLVQQYINPTYIENYGANIDSPDITLVETLAAHYTQDPDPLLDGRVIAQEITA
ncbi:hypothetical protein KC717_04380 [Candidatus Dojkabacteria bacterium]|uniref:Uncharacterized protein n=1 Tax=Candidatus Dojkabacteria bacterium TaxID=2099670 RepID=A0A955L997_9BACT|nr:hypothetical protein [Candidatus Dojkabacteria bacterium]